MIFVNNKNCWILATARSGSTYLANILNCTKIFPNRFDEIFQISSKTPEKLPPNAKIMPIQFRHHNLTKEIIESKIPNIRYIRILRKDKIAQAVSVYFCKITKTKHLRSINEVKSYLSQPIYWDEDLALDSWKEVKDANEKWNFFIKNKFIDLFYEDLLKNPIKEISKIINFLKIKCKDDILKEAVYEANNLLIRCIRPESEKYKNKMKKFLNYGKIKKI